MLLVISLLTLSMSVGLNSTLKLTQYVIKWVGIVLRFIAIYNYFYVSLIFLEIDLSTLSMGVVLKLPPFINPKCG